jgi:ATP-dependent Lon protease
MVVPIVVGRPSSIHALEKALEQDKLIYLISQKEFETEEPEPSDLFDIGCICRILQTVKLPDGSAKVLVEGIDRARTATVFKREKMFTAAVERLKYDDVTNPNEFEGLTRAALTLFEEYGNKNPKLPEEIHQTFTGLDDPIKLLHLLIGHMTIKPQDKIELLGSRDPHLAYLEVCRMLSREIELLNIEQQIYGEVRKQIDDQQKSYFLTEQIKAIERELGKKDYNEIREYEERFKKAQMPKTAEAIARKELQKLERMPQYSPEGAVIRNYLDWLLDVPWQKITRDNLNLKHARRVLDDTHYGLKEPKERVLEYLAVRKLRTQRVKEKDAGMPEEQSTVLCLVGPPGVGKTSLARAVAEALGRQFVRISLGGVRDEAEIRGHRRTYVGALPGRIVQALKKAGTRNPVMLLDEIDKISSDFRGDPSAALLEVLDPEQNKAFNDHYLEVDLDLSDVIFICTANVEDAIHPTLRDRMEKIELSSYTEPEKVEIARQFLLTKQRLAAGIPSSVSISQGCLKKIIRNYTCEAGVRQLDRSLAQIMRKIAVSLVTGRRKPVRLTVPVKKLNEYLGTPKHRQDLELPSRVPGIAVGLAWTETGGEILKIEVMTLDGKGELILTGQLGEVMQESARAAVTYVRKRQKDLQLNSEYFSKTDLHIHVPEGAIPKDGPSAGITIATALYSALSGKPVRPRLAMTGEITLGGNVLAVGGLKEKLLAAHRAGIKEIIMPKRSDQELDNVPKDVLKELTIHFVTRMDEVIDQAFGKR